MHVVRVAKEIERSRDGLAVRLKGKDASRGEGTRDLTRPLTSAPLPPGVVAQEGTISKPGSTVSGLHADIFYIPQKPYSVLGTLYDQLTYPEAEAARGSALTQARLTEILAQVRRTAQPAHAALRRVMECRHCSVEPRQERRTLTAPRPHWRWT